MTVQFETATVRHCYSDVERAELFDSLDFIRQVRGINPVCQHLEGGKIRIWYTLPKGSKREQRRCEHGRAF